MTDNNIPPKSQGRKQLLRSRFTSATWFIVASTLLGLFAVIILLYDAIMRL